MKHFLTSVMSFLFCFTGLVFNIEAKAAKPVPIEAGVTVEYSLGIQDPQVFVNFMFWTINVNCKVTNPEPDNQLLIEVLAKKGNINGMNLSEGATILLSLSSSEAFKVSAESGAKVRITNLSEHPIKTACTPV